MLTDLRYLPGILAKKTLRAVQTAYQLLTNQTPALYCMKTAVVTALKIFPKEWPGIMWLQCGNGKETAIKGGKSFMVKWSTPKLDIR